MTGQEALEQIGILKKQVEEQDYFIQELLSALNGLKGLSYEGDKVQTSVQGDPMLEKICRIEEEQRKLQRMMEHWISWKIRMIHQIHSMHVGNLQKLLYVMYIEDHTLAETAGIMNWSYEYTKKQHRKAIEEFSKCPLDIP